MTCCHCGESHDQLLDSGCCPDCEISNEDRAERAFRALQKYGGEGDRETNIQDLMVDLCHLADEYGMDVSQLLTMTEIHFNEETN